MTLWDSSIVHGTYFIAQLPIYDTNNNTGKDLDIK